MLHLETMLSQSEWNTSAQLFNVGFKHYSQRLRLSLCSFNHFKSKKMEDAASNSFTAKCSHLQVLFSMSLVAHILIPVC